MGTLFHNGSKNIAEIIRSNKLDIVAVHEISSKEALREIMMCPGGSIISECVSAASNARDSFSYNGVAVAIMILRLKGKRKG